MEQKEINETNETPKVETFEEVLNVGIGTKEIVKLQATRVKILAVTLEPQSKDGKPIGDKVVCTCKHPQRDDPIDISSVKYEKDKALKTSGLWFNKDDDKLIMKESALACFLRYLAVQTPTMLKGVEAETVIDDKGYLCFKAY